MFQAEAQPQHVFETRYQRIRLVEWDIEGLFGYLRLEQAGLFDQALIHRRIKAHQALMYPAKLFPDLYEPVLLVEATNELPRTLVGSLGVDDQ